MTREQITALIEQNKEDAAYVRLNAAFETSRRLVEMLERQQQIIDYLLTNTPAPAPRSQEAQS